jgi:hypothetical protein
MFVRLAKRPAFSYKIGPAIGKPVRYFLVVALVKHVQENGEKATF